MSSTHANDTTDGDGDGDGDGDVDVDDAARTMVQLHRGQIIMLFSSQQLHMFREGEFEKFSKSIGICCLLFAVAAAAEGEGDREK